MLNFTKKIKEKQKPLNCDFCGAKVKRPVTAEVEAPPYTLNFCCYGCKIGYLALDESESSVSGLIINDLKLSGRELIFKENTKESDAEEGSNIMSFGIKGITCSSCIPIIEKALELQKNVLSAKINPVSHTVTLNLEKDRSNIKDVKSVLKRLGYSISDYEDSYDNLKEESYSLLARFGFGVFMSMNIMVFSMLLYSKYFIRLRSSIVNYSHIILWFFATAIVAVVGYPIFKSAFKKLLSFNYNSDTLISIGVLSAYIYSSLIAFGLYGKNSGVFFDSAAMILILITFGKFLEAAAKKSSLSGLHNLIVLRPDTANIIRADGMEKRVEAKAIKAGDLMSVKAGDIIPADGELVSEYAIIDESMFSGEPIPVNRISGESVLAGSVNRSADAVKVKASSPVYKSYLFKMIRYAEKAYNMKLEPLRYVDEIAKVFVPVIAGVAFITFIVYYLITKDTGLSVMRFISVLVVACPCAFGLAAPLVVASAISKAQKKKILINGAETFELIDKADTIVFDKTGTLTEGLPCIKETVFAGIGVQSPELIQELTLAAGLIEENVSDRIAEAFRLKLSKTPSSVKLSEIGEPPVTNVEFKAGYGVKATYIGNKAVIGNMEFMKLNDIELSENIVGQVLNYERNGDTVVYMGLGGELKCFFVISDRIKDGAADAVREMHALGKRVIMLSGDSGPAVRFTALSIGINPKDAHSGMKPEEKLDFIKNLKNLNSGGNIVFVGDGLNDIPAMEEADVSVLCPSRYELPFNRSNAVLLDGNPASIVGLYRLAGESRKIIKENLLFSFIYNFAAVPLAVMGILNPLSSAVAMMASSIFITLNSMKVRMERDKIKTKTKAWKEKTIRKTLLNTNTLRG